MLKENIKLIDEDEGLLPLLPIPCNSIQDAVQDHQDAYTHQLLPQLVNVVANEPAGGIHICLLCESVQRSSCENLQFQCQVMCLLFRLSQKIFSEVIQCRWLTLIPSQSVWLVDMLYTSVDDGLLSPAELVAG